MVTIELNKRQELIIEIVKSDGPITGEHIADRLCLSRAALRPDLAILTMAGYLDARPRVGYFFSGKHQGEIYSKRLRLLKVKDYKSIPVVINEKSTAYDAMCMMFMEDLGTVFVTREEEGLIVLVGLVSKKDLLKIAVAQQNMPEIPISMVMTRTPHIITVAPTDSLYEAAQKIVEFHVNCLPVINKQNGKNELVGLISRTTITRVFVELGSLKTV